MSEYIKRNWFMILLGLALWAAMRLIKPLHLWRVFSGFASVLCPRFCLHGLADALEVVGQKLRGLSLPAWQR